MPESAHQLALLRDPRIAPRVLSPLPMWLWRADGSRIIFSNPIGAAVFGAPNAATLAARIFDLGQPAAAQIEQIGTALPHDGTPRLEKLRAFGAGVGRTLACNCSRIVLDDGAAAVLVVATERAGPELKLSERIRRLLAALPEPVAAFSADGRLLHAPPDSLERLSHATTLPALDAGALAAAALASGHAAGETNAGAARLDVIGGGADTVLLMTFPPSAPRESVQHDAAAHPPVEALSAAPVAEAPEPQAEAPTPAPEFNLPAPEEAPDLPADLAAVPAPTFDRRHPLRFVWQMDADGHFTLGSDEFATLTGPAVAGALGRPWSDIAGDLGLDPDGQVARAIATRNTWSGITVQWPVEGSSERLAVELSGLPVFDRDRTFRGYRGFGVCRDVDQLAAIAEARRFSLAAPAMAEPPSAPNVVPFRATTPPQPEPQAPEQTPALSPVEHHAFRELARQLNDRLQDSHHTEQDEQSQIAEPAQTQETAPQESTAEAVEPALLAPAPDRERPILDRVPAGVLVYRHNDLLYANRSFLAWTGHESLAALAEAGGLDALFIEPGIGETEDGGQTLTLSGTGGAQVPVQGRLFTVPWQGEAALALILVPAVSEDRLKAAETALAVAQAKMQQLRSALDAAQAEARELREAAGDARSTARDLRAVIDTAGDGVLALDRDGRILWANTRAQKMFGPEAKAGNALHELLMPGSTRVSRDEIERLAQPGAPDAPGEGHEVTGLGADGRPIALTMVIGRIDTDAQKFCAAFRDVTQWKKTADDLIEAKREADRASAAKSAFLAKISHEIRTPLNAIIGFSEVMMAERFGPIGNDRYRAYLKDIYASGSHLVSLLNDLLDLSKIEAGKMDLNFTDVGLNDLMQQCVAIMEPQANKERIIIRTSLSPTLPHIVADARSVRQIMLNLLSNSIKFTGAGGQVIVSSALNDNGQVVLRVRDTGAGMSEDDIATALEPFRQLATSARWGSGGTGLGLPLTKALAEANHASFSIKSEVNAGTLVEVAFPASRLPAAE